MDGRIPFRRTIRAKLVGLTVAAIAAITGVLALYFPSRQIEEMRRDQIEQVLVYGETLSSQLRSAVAFSDHETAREVLDSLANDQDLAYAALFDSSGGTIYEHGQSSKWVARARAGVTARKAFNYHNRVAVVVPVLSLEGPRGTLVIELSQARLAQRKTTVITSAIVLGVMMLLCGVVAATLITRSLLRRLREIGEVATSIAHGASSLVVDVGARDEIGVLAIAFNDMVSQLDAERGRLQATVSDLRAAESKLELNNRELETHVLNRTMQLRLANSQLKSEISQRNKVELELRQAQKMQSVGRLAAGVAHEINTPIQYIGDSVRYIGDAAPALVSTVQLQQQVVDCVLRKEDATELALCAKALADASDLEFALAELPAAAACSLEGLERVTTIVQSMKMFSHHQAVMAPADLNKAIVSTLTIARNEFKYVADVTTDLAELPPVMCNVGEINQVVLNLILNAAHAIEESVGKTGNRGRIVVTTKAEADRVTILVSDNGAGIPTEIRDRVFEPFFTTKSVGTGSGQGLAIAYSVVVENHHGTLTFESVRGAGTTFQLTIPVHQTQQARAA